MKAWDTEAISKAVESVPECSISGITPPEDYTTETIAIDVKGSEERIWVRGFRTDSVQPSSDQNQVEMVEVTSGYSDGDMPNDPIYCVVHAKVRAALMTLGYRVVNSLEAYF